MPKKINIAIISFYFLPEYSGAAKQISRLIEKLNRYNVNVIVLAARLDPEWPKEEKIGLYNVIRIPVGDNRSFIRFWLGTSWNLIKLRKDINIVFLNGLKIAHSYSAWLANVLSVPCIGRLSIANSDINFQIQGKIMGRLNKWFLSHVIKYIAISSELVKEVENSGLPVENCIKIVNGVDLSVYKPPTNRQRSSSRHSLNLEDRLVILFVGVIDKRKGIDVLINALGSIAKTKKNIKLILVGPRNRDDSIYNFYHTIQDIVSKNDLEENVQFFSYTENIIKFYHAADLFVLPSREEGMPNVLLEAIACGLPVVATRISGTSDIVEDGVEGLLVPPDDVNALSEAITKIVNDERIMKEMGYNSIKKAIDKFDFNKTAERYYNLFKNVLNTDEFETT